MPNEEDEQHDTHPCSSASGTALVVAPAAPRSTPQGLTDRQRALLLFPPLIHPSSPPPTPSIISPYHLPIPSGYHHYHQQHPSFGNFFIFLSLTFMLDALSLSSLCNSSSFLPLPPPLPSSLFSVPPHSLLTHLPSPLHPSTRV